MFVTPATKPMCSCRPLLLMRIFWSNARRKCAKIKPALLRPDAKSQVTFVMKQQTGSDRCRGAIHQHSPKSQQALHEAVMDEIILPVLPRMLHAGTKYFINPPPIHYWRTVGDCGLNRPKNHCRYYGGMARHGGAPFRQGPSKVDRSAAYMARYVPKTLLLPALQNVVKFRFLMRSALPNRRPSVLIPSAPARSAKTDWCRLSGTLLTCALKGLMPCSIC